MPQSLRILLIADDPEVIRRVGLGLQREDAGLIMIEGAESLATARRRLGAGVYDLALVDLALGEADALRVLAELHELAPELPFVALASGPEAPDARACLALGAQDRLGPDALDSASLLDRLQGAVARARVEQDARRRNRRIAASLVATGDLTWHYESGEEEVWLAAAEPAEWQLPAAESRESLESLRQRLHPDDRELTLRRVAELFDTAMPWQVEARVKVGGGAYRWCTLRGRSQLDAQGKLERASGMVSDAQRQQKRVRDLEHGRRFLRALFDSNRIPQAILDAAGVITDCNQAWYNLDDPACHAGHRFSPGRRLVDPAAEPGQQGDLDLGALARGVRQVLGGVVEQYDCEYGDGERRWRIVVSPLLNPGIAGAVVGHEEITASRRADDELHALLREAESDLRALAGAQLRLAPDFSVLATNPAGEALGRAPHLGRDVLKVLPRLHADAVGAALAELAGGAAQAVRDTRPEQGKVTRWLVSSRLDAEGQRAGFVALGVEVTDLAKASRPRPETEATNEIAGLRAALADAGQELETLRAAAGTAAREGEALRAAAATAAGDGEALQAALAAAEQEIASQRAATAEAAARSDALDVDLANARRELEEARRELEQVKEAAGVARQVAEEAAGRSETAEQAVAAARQECERAVAELGAELDAERARHAETLAALASAGQVPIKMRADLERARLDLRAELEALVERAFSPILGESQGGDEK